MRITFAKWDEIDEFARSKGYRPRDVHKNFQIWHELDDGRSLETDITSMVFFLGVRILLGRWIQHGGFWPDPKLRLFRRDLGHVEDRAVHETFAVDGEVAADIGNGALLHHSYPTLADYIDHMNRYSSLGAEMVVAKGPVRFSPSTSWCGPLATFLYNYFFRLGFLDGREGLLLHLYHAVYVSWKYAKAWELDAAVESRFLVRRNDMA